jgi:dephospho-CoA kinase
MEKVVLGITGSMGAGKSTVAKIMKSFAGKNSLVLDADKIAKKFLKYGSDSSKIVAAMFPEVLDNKENIDNKKLANAVFNGNGLQKLSSLIHPFVIRAIKQKMEKFKKNVIILDVPLLIEADMLDIVHKLIIVKAKKSAIIKRSKFEKKDLERRTAKQMPGKRLCC